MDSLLTLVNNNLVCTYLCTYCEIWMMNASTYFCIFVLPFQNNIKFNICQNLCFFFYRFQESSRLALLSMICTLLFISQSHYSLMLIVLIEMWYSTLNNSTQLWNCVWCGCYNIWIFPNCVSVLITATFSQMTSRLHTCGNWTEFLSCWGRGWWVRPLADSQAHSLCVQIRPLSCACAVAFYRPIWEAAEYQIQAGAPFLPCLLRDVPPL